MRPLRGILRRTADLSIRGKLLLSYFILVLFVLSLAVAVSSALVVRQNRAQVLRLAAHVFGQTRAYIQYKTESVRTLLYFLASSPAVQELFERREQYYRENIGRWPIDAQSFEKLSYVTSFNPDIRGTTCYMEYGLASVFQNETFVPLSRVQGEAWYAKLLRNVRRISWYVSDRLSPSDGRSLHAVRGVLDSQNISRVTGIIGFDIAQAMVAVPLANALLTESTGAWLVNSDGEQIAAAGGVGADDASAMEAKVLAQRGGDVAAETWSNVGIHGRGYVVGTQGIDGTDWVLVIAVPTRDIARMSARPAQSMLLVLLGMTPLTLSLALFVSRSATRRIDRLIAHMDSVADGDFTVRVDPVNGDEIGRLARRFNSMIAEIGQLIEEKYRLGKEVKNLELKALQAQINPHFLYNTLDLINWMSVRHGASEIGRLVGSLSRFYKLSLGKGDDMAGLGEELEHARSYVEIQNMRYENAITLEIAVPESLRECRVPRLILQPLVENAIFHSIMMKPEERGTVRITGTRSNGGLLLTVDDDGVGMPDELAAAILDGSRRPSNHHGYGVRNIHERLQLAFGAGSGLSFGVAPGGGTRVTIMLPGCARAAGG